MKKRLVMAMALCGMMAAVPITAGAYTVGVALGDGSVVCYSNITDKDEFTKESSNRQLLKEWMMSLEKFGVQYDVEKNCVTYEGERVRWISDKELENYEKNYLCERDGTTDLIVHRDGNGALSGVERADEQTFEIGTKAVEADDGGWAYEIAGGEIVKMDAGAGVLAAAIFEDDIVCEAQESCDVSASGAATEAAANSAYEDKKLREEEERREQEYESIGITRDNRNCWILGGKLIRVLMDEDGLFYSCGAEGAEAYVWVSRDREGKALSAEMVSGREALAHMSEKDRKEQE